jgi:DNA topoisomerase-3
VLGETSKGQEKSDEEEGDESGEAATLPEVTEGETLPVAASEILEKQTKPKPLHTESSLLAAMESAGREVADEAEREAMKDCGIGTPATRAAIIETLFRRDYIRREKKSLLPTDKGLAVYDTVKGKMIADVSMTGSWESALANIEHGKLMSDTFREAIVNYTRQITTELLETSGTFSATTEAASLPCPKCGQGTVRLYPKVAKCSDPTCGLLIFRGCLNHQLTDEQLTDLLTGGKTALIKGFKSKAGKRFDAALKLDADFKAVFEFPERKKKK